MIKTATPPETVPEIKAYFQNLDREEIEKFKNVYRYQGSVRLLRSTGWLNLLLSGFVLWLNLSTENPSALTIVASIFSAIIVVFSGFVLIRPSLKGIAVFSFIFLISGIWNIFLFLSNLSGITPRVSGIVVFLGLLQLLWAYQYWTIFKRYEHLAVSKPDEDESELYIELWQSLRGLFETGVNDPDAVEVSLAGRKWKGFLLLDRMVLIPATAKVMFLAFASEVEIVPQRAGRIKTKLFKGLLKYENTSLRMTIKQDNFDRFMQWLANSQHTSVSETISALERTANKPNPMRFIARIILVIGTLVVLYLIFMLVAGLLAVASLSH